eukprot:scaffold1636_cov165-Ochromonas_danica.AAC.3
MFGPSELRSRCLRKLRSQVGGVVAGHWVPIRCPIGGNGRGPGTRLLLSRGDETFQLLASGGARPCYGSITGWGVDHWRETIETLRHLGGEGRLPVRGPDRDVGSCCRSTRWGRWRNLWVVYGYSSGPADHEKKSGLLVFLRGASAGGQGLVAGPGCGRARSLVG